MKTSELTGAALDWAVAKADGRRVEYDHQYTDEIKFEGWWQLGPNHWQPLNSYSTNWAQGGPIIERHNLMMSAEGNPDSPTWMASLSYSKRVTYTSGTAQRFCSMQGPTPLIAAMRCYVASKLGEEVDLPEGLS